MARQLTLATGATITLDGNGDGVAQLGPQAAGVVWTVNQAACATTSSASNPVFNLYLGDPNPDNFIGGSFSGNNDATDLPGIVLQPGQYFTGTWDGGDPGAIATLSIFGTQQVP